MNNTFFVYSVSVADRIGDGFWSNDHGWTNLVGATRFTREETQTLNLPTTPEGDARWMSAREAYGCESELERFVREIGPSLKIGHRQFEVVEIKGEGDIVCAGIKAIRATYTAIRCNNSKVAGHPDAEVWSILGNGKGRQIASFAIVNNQVKALA